ncbi:MAG: hypothetical protein QXM00_04730 [Candidatus Bathyarchaeia archaeon]
MTRTVIRSISLPKGLDELIGEILKTFGLSRSDFITAALIDYIRNMGLIADGYVKLLYK